MEQVTLDIHTHLVPVAPDELASFAGVAWDGTALDVDDHRIGVKALFQPDALVAWLDANRIDAAWISAPPPLYRQHLPETQAAAWIDYVNRGLQALAAPHSRRLTALTQLPTEHPDLAADIAAKAALGGARRFNMPSGGEGRVLSDAAYEPLWQALNSAGAFVLLHPGECPDPRLARFYLGNLLGNPYETTLAIAHLVFGGVVERFPHITFCFAHGGGAAAMLAGRFGQGYRAARPGINCDRRAPGDLLAALHVDCITHDAAALQLAEAAFGPSQIVFGSDWPFPMGLMQPHDELAGVTPALRARLFRTNPARLLAA